ncbi:MAG: RIP metalloprotease RseP [Acidobacteria bacterium]|nr:RIP metalloprotease RseP [Acidobacteriota bacterium]
MVLVHEFGHFLVAKLCGVRVETFSIGFGKRLFGFRRGDTDYRLSLLPFGGYVKMSGEQPGEVTTGEAGEFASHPRWQRVLIALAGPVFNFILAFFLMLAVGLYHHEVPEGFQGPAVVDYVTAGSPAAKAGVQTGDTIVHFESKENPDWQEIFARSSIFAKDRVHISYLHEGQRVDTMVGPEVTTDVSPYPLEVLGMIARAQQHPVGALQVMPDTPASRAGLQDGDQILTIDGLQLHSVDALLSYLSDTKGKPSVLRVLRNGSQLDLHITPEMGDIGGGHQQYRLGFRPARTPVQVGHLPLPAAIKYSWDENVRLSRLIVDVIHGMFTRRVSVKSVSGPVGIFQEVGMASEMGNWPLVQVMASISLNLGIFNLLPFPILDGGMILFLLIESILRRDLSQVWKERIYQAAFILLLLFAALIIFNDFSKLPMFHH